MSLESFSICRQTHKHTQERHLRKIILNYATAVFYMFVFLSMFGWAKMRFMQFYYQSHNRLLYDNVIVCLSANEFFMRHVSTIKKASISLFTCSVPFAKYEHKSQHLMLLFFSPFLWNYLPCVRCAKTLRMPSSSPIVIVASVDDIRNIVLSLVWCCTSCVFVLIFR